LEWTASTDPAVTGYRVYFGQASHTYAQMPGYGLATGKTTSYTITGLQSARTYYFAVTAIDGTGNESPPSNEASKLIK